MVTANGYTSDHITKFAWFVTFCTLFLNKTEPYQGIMRMLRRVEIIWPFDISSLPLVSCYNQRGVICANPSFLTPSTDCQLD